MTEYEILLKIASLAATDDDGSYTDAPGKLEAIANILVRNQIGVNHR